MFKKYVRRQKVLDTKAKTKVDFRCYLSFTYLDEETP